MTLDMIQLHGDESPELCRQFSSSIVIKAVDLKNDDDLKIACCYGVAAILADNRHAGLYGGTGKKADWELAFALKNKKCRLFFPAGLMRETLPQL